MVCALPRRGLALRCSRVKSDTKGLKSDLRLFEHDGDGRPVVQADAIRAPLDSPRG